MKSVKAERAQKEESLSGNTFFLLEITSCTTGTFLEKDTVSSDNDGDDEDDDMI